MTHQVLALKWRPRTFEEVVGQPHVVKALTNGLENNRLHHAFLFTGTRGVGKTTLARIFAKSLNCEEGVSATPCGVCSICQEVDAGRFVDLIEIDAASRTKVEDTREILDNVQYAPTRGRFKVYLIDEVHMLSNSSFNALLKTLEEPPSHVKFLLATTDPQKLPITVLSRCLRFQLRKISTEEIEGQLAYLLTEEKLSFEERALKLIAKAGEGSMRDALSILDQAIAYTAGKILYDEVREMLGLIDHQYVLAILERLAENDPHSLLNELKELSSFSLDYERLLEELIEAFHELTLLQVNPDFTERDHDELLRYQALAEHFSPEELQLYYQIALHGRRDLSLHPNSELGFEMTLLRMLLFSPGMPRQKYKKKEQRKLTTAQSIKGDRETEPVTPLVEPSAATSSTEVKAKEIASSNSRDSNTPLEKGDEAEPPSLPQSNEEWLTIVEHLELDPIVRGIAFSLVFSRLNEGKLLLIRSEKERVFDVSETEARLGQAVSRYLQQPVVCQIEYLESALPEDNFYQRKERIEAEELRIFKEQLQKDENIRYLTQECNARILEKTIQLTNNKEVG